MPPKRLPKVKATTSGLVAQKHQSAATGHDAAGAGMQQPWESILDEFPQEGIDMVDYLFTRGGTREAIAARRALVKDSSMSSIFASDVFRQHNLVEIADFDRRRVGPEFEQGFVDCKKCRSSKTMSKGEQRRSADEPVTWTHRCIDCKFIWRTDG